METTKSLNIDDKAKEARRAYQMEWRAKNRARLREYNKAWRRANPDKVKAAAERYWTKKAAQE